MRERIISVIIFSLFIFHSFCFSVCAEAVKGDFGVGLNYPGIGIRYLFSNRLSLECKGQYADDITVAGLRGYYYLSSRANILLFTGIETDYISFKGEESEGTGIASEFFVGGEYFFIRNISIQLDIGPAYIYLKDKDVSVTVDGIEYVVNIGINYYL